MWSPVTFRFWFSRLITVVCNSDHLAASASSFLVVVCEKCAEACKGMPIHAVSGQVPDTWPFCARLAWLYFSIIFIYNILALQSILSTSTILSNHRISTEKLWYPTVTAYDYNNFQHVTITLVHMLLCRCLWSRLVSDRKCGWPQSTSSCSTHLTTQSVESPHVLSPNFLSEVYIIRQQSVASPGVPKIRNTLILSLKKASKKSRLRSDNLLVNL